MSSGKYYIMINQQGFQGFFNRLLTIKTQIFVDYLLRNLTRFLFPDCYLLF